MYTFHGAAFGEVDLGGYGGSTSYNEVSTLDLQTSSGLSTWLSSGIVGGTTTYNFAAPVFAPMDDGLLGMVQGPSGGHAGGTQVGGWAVTYFGGGFNCNDGSTMDGSCWVRGVDVAAGKSVNIVQLLTNTSLTYNDYVSIDWTPTGLLVQVGRGGAAGSFGNGMALSTLNLNADTFIGWHIVFTSTGATVHLQVNSTINTGTITVGNPTGRPSLPVFFINGFLWNGANTGTILVRDLNLTSNVSAWTASYFDPQYLFQPNATMDTFEPNVQATPLTVTDPWETLQAIASAEQAVVLFDEVGHLVVKNRDTLAGAPLVEIITPTRELKALGSHEDIDAIRNRISVSATPWRVNTDRSEVIWSLNEVLTIAPGDTIDIEADIGRPVFDVNTFDTHASKTADGTGGNLILTALSLALVSPTIVRMTWWNNTAFTAYLVGNIGDGSEQGQPYGKITGRASSEASDSTYTYRVDDSGSINTYGVQPLDFGGSSWRQSNTAAQAVGNALLASLATPHPTLTGVQVVANPTRQLGDRVTVNEPDYLALSADYLITSITTTLDASGLSQNLNLRGV
jgi:hypothetical protein